MELKVRNVNEALSRAVRLFMSSPDVVSVSPRGAATYEWPEPVVTMYERPKERVLFSQVRDANPFFHFFESLWMLAGRNDVKFVSSFVKRMAEYSHNGEVQPGAYGRRWRSYFGFDQIPRVIAELQVNPDTRRVVMGMWDPVFDFANAGSHRMSKDLPCNTHIYFKLRNGVLNMTVCCRSNDVIWGAYGANAVHFSMLHEYIADKVGARVGTYTHLSDSWHVYTGGEGGKVWDRLCAAVRRWPSGALTANPYETTEVRPMAINADHPAWDTDLEMFFEAFDHEIVTDNFASPWFKHVVKPLYDGWLTRDQKRLEYCMASDWRVACQEWLQRHPRKVTA